MRTRKLKSIVPVLLLTLGACAHLKAPASLSPAGDVAYHARQTVVVLTTMVNAVTDGVRSGVISKEDGLKVADAAEKAIKAGHVLEDALRSGDAGSTAKDQALGVLRSVLSELPGQLSGNAAKIVAQYCNVALTLLSVFGR